MSESDYSYSLTTFSPTGKLVQIEYALEAVNHGSPALGIKATNGVVLACSKKNSPLVDPSSIERISLIDTNVGCVSAGLSPDFRVIVKKARKEAQAYKLKFGEEPSALAISSYIGSLMQEYTQAGGVRPMGCSLLVAGFDMKTKQPSLYQIDPSGSFWSWKATGIGKDSLTTKQFLEKRYEKEKDLGDAIHTAILTLKETFDGVLTPEGLDVAVVGLKEDGTPDHFHLLTEDEIGAYLRENE